MDQFGYDEASAIEKVISNTAPTVLMDEQFVRDLYNNDRTLFDKIREFFEELRQGFAELTQSGSLAQDTALDEESVRKIADVFEEVARGDLSQEGNGIKYPIKYDGENRPFVVIHEDILAGVPEKDWLRTVRENIRSKFGEGIVVGNEVVNVKRKTATEMTYYQYSRHLREHDPDVFKAKMRATNNLNEVLVASRDYVSEAPSHERKDDIHQFSRGNVLLRIGGNDYQADVVVATKTDNTLLLYDMLDFKKTLINEKKKMQQSAQPHDGGIGRSVASSENNIADASSVVKFSAKDPVERKDTLLAIHNLTGDKLKKFLALGGAPMPSIAVTRSDVEHSNF